MRKILLLAATLLCGLGAQAQEQTFQVKLSLDNMPDSVMMVTTDTRRNPLVLTPKGKTLVQALPLQEPTPVMVRMHSAEQKKWLQPIVFLGVPGEKATITLEGDHYAIKGSPFYEELWQLLSSLRTVTTSEQLRDSLLTYLKTHPESEAVLVPMDNYLKPNDALTLLEAISPKVKEGRMRPVVEMITAQANAEKAREAKQGEGVVAPDFTLKTLEGKDLSLSSLKGKYVLLDFWGSWCVWCIRGIPKMKEYYEKYAGKFEILSVDCNDSDAAWRAAVKKHDLKWLHVYNPQGSTVLEDYGVQGFPTKIMVGPDGKIVRAFVGETPDFYDFLDQTFGK